MRASQSGCSAAHGIKITCCHGIGLCRTVVGEDCGVCHGLGYGRFLDGERCAHVGDGVVVVGIARELSHDGVGAGSGLAVVLISYGNAVWQCAADGKGMRIAVIGNRSTHKGHTAHVIGGLVDGQGSGHVGDGVVVGVTREFCHNGVVAGIGLAVVLVGDGNAVRQRAADRKGVCVAVIGNRSTYKGHTAHVIGGLLDGEGCGHIGDIVVVRIVDRKLGHNGVGACSGLTVVLVSDLHAAWQCAADGKGMRIAVIGHRSVLKGHTVHVVAGLCDDEIVLEIVRCAIRPLIVFFIIE